MGSNIQPEAAHDASIRILPCPLPPNSWQALSEAVAAEQCKGAALLGHLHPRPHRAPCMALHSHPRCRLLGREGPGRRFADRALNSWLARTFHAVHAAAPQPVVLGPHGLHHAHLFRAHAAGQGLGLLFHAAEYPAYCEQGFPVHLGYCQAGSTLQYSPDTMAWRNFVWYGGSLAALDTGPSSPLNQRLVYPGLEALGTVYEGSFGDWLADVYYISWWAERRRQQRILVSLPGIPHAPARRRRPELG
ncbi:CGL39 [Auxenochlorella protothecoides x Auxenochlorella symbiontica]